jgi:hypothetical protein
MIIVGFLLIGYGAFFRYGDARWDFLENIANYLAAISTLVGTSVVACLAYFPPHTRRSDSHSRYVIAPFILILITVSIIRWVCTRSLPSPHVVNGFAILGIAGSILRALPFSEWRYEESALSSETETKAK